MYLLKSLYITWEDCTVKGKFQKKYISSLCNKPKASSMNKSLLEQLIWHQNSAQKKTNKFFLKKLWRQWWWREVKGEV